MRTRLSCIRCSWSWKLWRGRSPSWRERRATLETSRADAHKSGLSMQCAAKTPTTSTPCVSLHRPRAPGMRSSQMSFTPVPGNHGPWVQQRKKRSRPRTTTSQITDNSFDVLCLTETWLKPNYYIGLKCIYSTKLLL